MRISDWSSDVCSSDLIDPIRIKGAGRFALAAINNAGSQAQLRLVRQAEGLGRPYRRNVAWHILEAAVHLRAELIITVVAQQLEITRQRLASLALAACGGQLARLCDAAVRPLETTVPLLDL